MCRALTSDRLSVADVLIGIGRVAKMKHLDLLRCYADAVLLTSLPTVTDESTSERNAGVLHAENHATALHSDSE